MAFLDPESKREHMRDLAYAYHSGGGSALYVWASTGLYTYAAQEEVLFATLDFPVASIEEGELLRLGAYLSMEEFTLRRQNYVLPTDPIFLKP